MLLAAATLIAFWPVTRCDFLNYDDTDYFTSNPHVLTGLTMANISWAFTTGHASNWHPITWLSLMFDASWAGKNPFVPHLTNLLFHTANVILLFLLLRRLTAATWRSAFVAALFALHPLHVESVAWVSERKDVLSLCFGLLALLAYARYAKQSAVNGQQSVASSRAINYQPSTIHYFLSLLLFALSLMSKPMLVTLPFLMLLLDWWPLQRISTWNFQLANVRAVLLEKIPFLMLSLASSVITFVVQQKGGAVATFTSFPLPERVANAFVSYARYLGKTVWPEPLANPYPHPGHWDLSLVIYSVALVAGLSAIAVLLARKYPFAFTGWFWFLGTLIPMIGLVQVGEAAMADRYSYLPLIGIFIIVVWGAGEVFARWRLPQAAIALAAALILLASAVQTRSQLQFWRNSETLFRHTLAMTENNQVAWNNLGTWLSGSGQVAEAMDCFRRALQIKPGNPNTLYNLGNAFAKLGNWDEAINNYQSALQTTPDAADILSNLGFALAARKQYADATACFEKSLKLDPDSADAHNNFATVLFIGHRFDEAAQHYRAALRLAPDNPQICANLGDVLVKLGQTAEAVQSYQKALRLQPDNERVKAKLQALGVK